MTGPLFIGIDAGATHTRVYAASPDDQEPFISSDSGVNLYRTPQSEALRCIGSLIESARVHFPGRKTRGLVVGVAGGSHESKRNALERGLRSTISGIDPDHISVIRDSEIALEGAFDSGSGILVIVGTGSIVFGRTVDGTYRQSGGLGYLLGDPGSGMVLGLAGLRVLAEDLETNSISPLGQRIADDFGLADRSSLLEHVYRASWPAQQVAPTVLDMVAEGDSTSTKILHKQLLLLARDIERVANKGDSYTKHVAFSGGLYNHSAYREAIHSVVRDVIPGWEIVPVKHAADYGAWKIATKFG